MNFDMSRFQALTANLAVEGEVCDLAQAKLSTETETDTEIAPLIEKVGATSMAEIDRLMAELQAQKNFSAIRGRANSARDGSLCEPHLDNFGLRKNHFDTVSGWREASHPMPEFEIMRSPAKDSTGRMERPID